MELAMIGNRLKAMRERKCWSQQHLADAAGLNIRTVQRIESGDPCSDETMLSLAAALDVDISELALAPTQPHRVCSKRSWHPVLSATLIGPAAIFVTVNVVRSVLGWSGPYNLFAAAGARVMNFETFNFISPIVFLGGSAAAIAVALAHVVNFEGNVHRRVWTISAIRLQLQASPVATLLIGTVFTSLLAYVVAEQFGTLVQK
jgi:DNA-binding XRE family transcriptional regulator